MKRRVGILVAVLVLGSSARAAFADSAPALRFDPFRTRPADASAAIDDSQAVVAGFEPVLRSTVVSSERSMVNLGGEILFVGEETHGFRLIAVRSFDALFTKEGRTIRLELSAGPEEEL